MLYAPEDSRFIRRKYDADKLIIDNEGIQDNGRQISIIVDYMKANGLKSAEVIGAFPGCINLVGDSLKDNGLIARVIHTDGRVKIYQ